MTEASLRLADLLWKPRGVWTGPSGDPAQEGAGPGAHGIERCAELLPEPGCPCRVAELAGGKVIGSAKLATTADDVVLADVQFLYGATDPARHWLLAQRRPRLPRRLRAKAALLAASNAENYYHWLFDSLPRLRLLELAGYGPGDIDVLLLDHSRRAFQFDSLRHLGIDPGRLVHCSRRQVLACERLVVPSMPGPVGFPPRWVCDYLRERFVAPQQDAPRRRIYLSRQQARGLRIVNEAEILPDLLRLGYEVVHAEALGFIAQVACFASASHVVAVHGAGVSNIVFAHPGTRVLELGSPRHNNLSFRTVAAHGDLRYEHFYLDAAPGADGADTRFADVVAPPQAFRRRLEAFSA